MGFYIGQRLSIDSHNCTVRYYGDVKGTNGLWLGVEWDDASRGKHDGRHQGEKYFSCVSKNESAASFIRPARTQDLPFSFLQALRERYVAGNKEISKDQDIYFNGKLAEKVGFDKVQQRFSTLHELKVVILGKLCIKGLQNSPHSTVNTLTSWENTKKEVYKVCPKIKELDLSRNLFEEIEDVEGICSALPDLEHLNISQNRFRTTGIKWSASVDKLKSPFDQISELQANYTLLLWDEVVSLTAAFPRLQSFSFAANDLKTVSSPLPSQISSLDLSNNNFRSINDVAPLAQMPFLHALSLRDCPISSICSDQRTVFHSMKELDVSKTGLMMEDFYNLERVFPNLTRLRCPIYDESQTLVLIARLIRLEFLNSSSITSQVRNNAELFYLSTIAKEINDDSTSSEQKVLSRHPRWMELCQQHGEPSTMRVKASSRKISSTVKARLVNLICRDVRGASVSREYNSGESEFELRLPNSLSMCRVYMHIANKLQTLPIHLNIVWETDEWDLANKTRTLRKEPEVIHVTTSSSHSAHLRSTAGTRSDDPRLMADGGIGFTDYCDDDQLTSSSEDGESATEARASLERKQRDEDKRIRREINLVPDSRQQLGNLTERKEICVRVEDRIHP